MDQPMTSFRNPDQIIRDALVEEIEWLLNECTDEQQVFFFKMYPGGIAKMDVPTMKNAIMQCQRTIVKNQSEK